MVQRKTTMSNAAKSWYIRRYRIQFGMSLKWKRYYTHGDPKETVAQT